MTDPDTGVRAAGMSNPYDDKSILVVSTVLVSPVRLVSEVPYFP